MNFYFWVIRIYYYKYMIVYTSWMFLGLFSFICEVLDIITNCDFKFIWQLNKAPRTQSTQSWKESPTSIVSKNDLCPIQTWNHKWITHFWNGRDNCLVCPSEILDILDLHDLHSSYAILQFTTWFSIKFPIKWEVSHLLIWKRGILFNESNSRN